MVQPSPDATVRLRYTALLYRSAAIGIVSGDEERREERGTAPIAAGSDRSRIRANYFLKVRMCATILSASAPETPVTGFILPTPSVIAFLRSASLLL